MSTCTNTDDQPRIRANIQALKQTRNFVRFMSTTSPVTLRALKINQTAEFSEDILTAQLVSVEQHQLSTDNNTNTKLLFNATLYCGSLEINMDQEEIGSTPYGNMSYGKSYGRNWSNIKTLP